MNNLFGRQISGIKSSLSLSLPHSRGVWNSASSTGSHPENLIQSFRRFIIINANLLRAFKWSIFSSRWPYVLDMRKIIFLPPPRVYHINLLWMYDITSPLGSAPIPKDDIFSRDSGWKLAGASIFWRARARELWEKFVIKFFQSLLIKESRQDSFKLRGGWKIIFPGRVSKDEKGYVWVILAWLLDSCQ